MGFRWQEHRSWKWKRTKSRPGQRGTYFSSNNKMRGNTNPFHKLGLSNMDMSRSFKAIDGSNILNSLYERNEVLPPTRPP